MSQIRHDPVAPTAAHELAGGHVVQRHRHGEHQLVYVSTGVLAVRTSSGTWVASCDRAVWLPAGTWHDHRFYGASRFHTVGFRLGDRPLPTDRPAIVAVGPLLRALLVACTEPDPAPEEHARLRGVLADRLRRAPVHPVSVPTADDPRLADACAIVEDDLSRTIPLSELARRTSSSERTLARLFRGEFGTTYPQWRARVRVVRAMVLLASGAHVTETAHRCGWATTSAFVDAFRRIVGQTPGAYRSAVS